jgi:hypothetical protein
MAFAIQIPSDYEKKLVSFAPILDADFLEEAEYTMQYEQAYPISSFKDAKGNEKYSLSCHSNPTFTKYVHDLAKVVKKSPLMSEYSFKTPFKISGHFADPIFNVKLPLYPDTCLHGEENAFITFTPSVYINSKEKIFGLFFTAVKKV